MSEQPIAPEPILKVVDLSVHFDDQEVLQHIDFSAHQGEVLAIVGPNGSGKSVLARALLGLVPSTGKIRWAAHQKIGYIPQHLNIERDLPLTIKEFFALKSKNRTAVLDVLESVGLIENKETDILDKPLGLLSGGQLQRTMIAWSIIDHPTVLLYDEPTSGIDVGGEETIYNLLKRLKSSHKMTIMIISHDLNMVYKYADTVLCINKELVCHGVPSIVLDPTSLAKLYGGEATFYQHQHASKS